FITALYLSEELISVPGVLPAAELPDHLRDIIATVGLGAEEGSIAAISLPPADWAGGPVNLTVEGTGGTLGFPVRRIFRTEADDTESETPDQSDALLTAAHVAPREEAEVTVGEEVIGIVRQVHGPSPGHPGADVALIEPRVDLESLDLIEASGIARVFPGEEVVVHRAGARGAITVGVSGYAEWFHFTKHDLLYANLYLTEGGVTDPGDSGAPVTKDGLAIAHVIGAAGSATTFAQDFPYQLDVLSSHHQVKRVELIPKRHA
ncbi:MAG: serine protease, partial [Chloroflexi bacterium]|nr:serine protease [Chloroflexota bacterium]